MKNSLSAVKMVGATGFVTPYGDFRVLKSRSQARVNQLAGCCGFALPYGAVTPCQPRLRVGI